MKKIIFAVIMCTLCLCGCDINKMGDTENITPSSVDDNTKKSTTTEETSIVGVWKHSEYPNAYSIDIKSVDGRNMKLIIEAMKGKGTQIATAEIDDAYFMNNSTRFNFEDSFGNTGICEIKIVDNEMEVSYDMNPYKGDWCVDAGEGIYIKDNSLSVNSGYNDKSTSSNSNEMKLPANTYFDSGKYVKVMGYGYDGDVYDKDIYYQFDWTEDDEFVYGNYNDNSYGRDQFGSYKVLSSEKPGYDFKLIFDYADGHNELFYVKTVVDRMVFDFYLIDGTAYNRFENYDEYAVKRTNPDKNTHRLRYDYEYKAYRKSHGDTMESPFKTISK